METTWAPRSRRPLSITVVTVLAVLSGVLDVLGGSLLLAQSSNATLIGTFGGLAVFFPLTIACVANGIAVLVAAFGVLRGSRRARIIVTILQAFSMSFSVYFAIISSVSIASELVSLVVAIAVVVLLWSRSARGYFVAGVGASPEQR